MADGRWALGLDGGNTKTLAVVGVAGADGRAEVRGVGRAGCADIYGAPSPGAALEQMESAVGKALHEAGIGAHYIVPRTHLSRQHPRCKCTCS